MTHRTALALAALLVLGARSAQAQSSSSSASVAPARMRWGPQVSYNFESDDVGFGGRLEYPLTRLLGNPRIAGMFEANWFPGTVDLFDLNYNVAYVFRAPNIEPYAGGGLNFSIASGNGNTSSDLHLNALGGVRFGRMGRITPMLQLRYVFAGSGDGLILTGGVLF